MRMRAETRYIVEMTPEELNFCRFAIQIYRDIRVHGAEVTLGNGDTQTYPASADLAAQAITAINGLTPEEE